MTGQTQTILVAEDNTNERHMMSNQGTAPVTGHQRLAAQMLKDYMNG